METESILRLLANAALLYVLSDVAKILFLANKRIDQIDKISAGIRLGFLCVAGVILGAIAIG